MKRLPYIVLAVFYVALGLFEISEFAEHETRTRVSGIIALLTGAVASVGVFKPSGRSLAVLSGAVLVCLAAYLWPWLTWSAGHDGPALFWLYAVGPLNLVPVIVIAIMAVLNSLSLRKAPAK